MVASEGIVFLRSDLFTTDKRISSFRTCYLLYNRAGISQLIYSCGAE